MSREAARQEAVFRDSIRAMQQPLRMSHFAVVIVALLLVTVLRQYYPTPALLTWFAGVVLVQYGPGLLVFGVNRASVMTQDPHFVARFCLLASALSGGYWGGSVMYFVNSAQPEIQFFIALSLGGMVAANVSTLALYPLMMRVYILSMVLPFSLWAVLQPEMLNRYLGIGMALLVGYLLYFGQFHIRTVRRTIELRHENADLVAQLQAHTEALEKASAAKSQFFAAASHDLRQPLHALGYYTSLLKPNVHDAAHIERIQQCLGSLDDLLEGVLDISRLDAGRVQPHIGPVAIGELLRRLASLYEGAATAKGLRLHVHAPALWALSDSALLERILANLLGNALRYTEHGGVLLAVRRSGSCLRLQVMDTGIGIPEQSQNLVFDEFVQLNNPQRDPSRGVGLGLATVRRLCELLGHSVTLRSVTARGSCFELRLPMTEAPPAVMTPQTERGESPPLQGRVLVVDDHELVRDSLVQTLAGWGLDCDGAADGPQAIAMGQANRYDAVLCDWRLPDGMDGTQVLAALRALQPTLALTALVTGETESSLGTVPVGVPVLRKPIRPIRLRALLTAHLSTHATNPTGDDPRFKA